VLELTTKELISVVEKLFLQRTLHFDILKNAKTTNYSIMTFADLQNLYLANHLSLYLVPDEEECLEKH
jgi:hypothetical protein